MPQTTVYKLTCPQCGHVSVTRAAKSDDFTRLMAAHQQAIEEFYQSHEREKPHCDPGGQRLRIEQAHEGEQT